MTAFNSRRESHRMHACVLYTFTLLQSTCFGINIAPRASLASSSTTDWHDNDYTLPNAVDGIWELDIDSCGCCFSSEYENHPYFEANFDRPYTIQNITVIGRQNDTEDDNVLTNIDVFLDKISATVQYNNASNTATIDVNDGSVQTIRIVRHRIRVFLTICEIIIDAKVCPYNFYGDKCMNQCHCRDKARCNVVDGTCENHLCAAGWQTESCSQECSHVYFGYNCTSKCHCLDNDECNKVTGTCNNNICATGWTGRSCSEACPFGTFGSRCLHTCGSCKDNSTCDHVSGICPDGCVDGFVSPDCNVLESVTEANTVVTEAKTVTVVTEENKDAPMLRIGLGITGAVSVCLVTMVVYLVVRLRRLTKRQTTEAENTEHTYEKPTSFDTPPASLDYDTLRPENIYEMKEIDRTYINLTSTGQHGLHRL